MIRASRTPNIVADAAYIAFNKPSREFSGKFLIDDTFLIEEGLADLDRYRVDRTRPLQPDFFVPPTSEPPGPLSALSP